MADMDTNDNLSTVELERLREERRFAWIRRKFLNTRRYRRQYLRTMQARRKAQRRMDGFISFPLFCKIVTRRISLTNTPFDINKAMLYGVET